MLGLLLTTVGLDVVSGMPRFAFGVPQLLGGRFHRSYLRDVRRRRGCSIASSNPKTRAAIKGKLRLGDMFLTWEDWLPRAGRSRGQRHRFLIGMIPAGASQPHRSFAYLARSGTPNIRAIRRGAIEGWLHRNREQTRPRLAALPPCWRWVFRVRNTAVIAGRLHDVGHSSRPPAFHAACRPGVGTHRQYVCRQFLLLLMNIFLIPIFVAMLRIPYSIMMGLIVVFATVGLSASITAFSTSG